METVRELRGSLHGPRLPVHDPEGLHALVRQPRLDRPAVELLRGLAEEFLRMQALFPAAVVAREDWLLGVVGVTDNQRLLYTLFVGANQPLPPTGQKQWSAKLTPEQRAVLTALRVPQPERDDLIEAMRATQRAWREHGRAALLAAGGEWPEELDAAVTAFWGRELSSP